MSGVQGAAVTGREFLERWRCVGICRRRDRCMRCWRGIAVACFAMGCSRICLFRVGDVGRRRGRWWRCCCCRRWGGLSDRVACARLRIDVAWKTATGLALTGEDFMRRC